MTTVQRRGPGSRADERHPTRAALLDAAAEVLEERGLHGLSVSEVTERAGVAKGTFYVHFPNRSELVVALHRRFHDAVFEDVVARTAALRPGPERAGTALDAFLDCCRAHRGVRALLLESRSDPAVREEMRLRNEQAAESLAGDLAHAGPSPIDTARLIVAATAECATQELEIGTELPGMRKALATLVALSASTASATGNQPRAVRTVRA